MLEGEQVPLDGLPAEPSGQAGHDSLGTCHGQAPSKLAAVEFSSCLSCNNKVCFLVCYFLCFKDVVEMQKYYVKQWGTHQRAIFV